MSDQPMESWRKVWRDAVVPLLTRADLEVLRNALETDDPRLVQGATTVPPPMQCVSDWPCEAACPLGYVGASRFGGLFDPKRCEQRLKEHDVRDIDCATVAQAEEFFAVSCYEIDKALGEPAGCRHLLNFFDETPRDEMRRELLSEVLLALKDRESDEEKTITP